MAVSLEGTFRLHDRASGVLGRLQAMAKRTDDSFSRLGKRLDQHGRSMERLRRDNSKSEQSFGRLTKSMAKFVIVVEGMKKALAGVRLIGMVAGVRMLIPAVAALGGGLAALIPKLTDVAGIAGAMPATLGGMGLAMVTVKLATKDLSTALSGNEKALKSLTPEARRFVETLKAAKPLVESIRRSAQRGLFPGLEQAVGQLTKAAPMMRRLTNEMGKALGGLAAQAAGRFTSRGFLNDLSTLGSQGIRVVRRLGMGLMNLVDALRHVAVAAMPFTEWLSKTLLGWTRYLDVTARVKRDSGELAAYFERTQKALVRFGHILKSVWLIMRDVGRAARSTGDALWWSADKSLRAWQRWTSSITGQEQLRAWFKSTRDTLSEIFGLAGDLGKVLGRMSQQGNTAGIIHGLRGMVPLIERIVNTLTNTFGPPMLALIQEFARSLDFYVNKTAFPVANLLGALAGILHTVNDLIDRFPALGKVISAAFTGWATYALFKQIGLVQALAGAWGMVAKSAGSAAAAEGVAASVGGVGGAAAAVGASGGLKGFSRALGAGGGAAAAAGGASRLGAMARLGGMGAGLGLAAKGALGVAGKAFLPLAALQFGIGAFTARREGGVGEQVARSAYGGLNSMAFGLLPEWTTRAQREERFAGGMLGQSYNDPGATVMASRAVPYRGVGRGGVIGGGMRTEQYATHPGATTKLGVQGLLDQASALKPTSLKGVVMQISLAKRAADLAAVAQRRGAKGAADALAYAKQTLQTYKEQATVLLEQQRSQRKAGRVADARGVTERLMSGLQSSLASDEKKLGRVKAIEAFRQRLHKAIMEVPPSEQAQFARAGEAVANQATKGLKKGSKAYKEAREAATGLKKDIVATLRATGRTALEVNGKIVVDAQKQWPKWRTAILQEAKAAAAGLPNHMMKIRSEARSGLKSMGYSDAQIERILGAAARGATAGGSLAAASGGRGASLSGVGGSSDSNLLPGVGLASGGRIQGRGLHDTVPLNGKTVAAPGELVVNRHTESKIDRILSHAGTSLNREVAREGRPHSWPMKLATGGRVAQGGGGYSYPLGARGTLIGTPHSGTHTLGNWQSDNAIDLGVPQGTPVLAVAPGVIGSRFGSLGASGSSRFAGLRMTLNTAADAFYYAHLSRFAEGIAPGASVQQGQILGYSGSANGVEHLHLGEQVGNPMALIGAAVAAARQARAMKRINAKVGGIGVPHLMAQAGAQGYANALVSRINQAMSPAATPGDAGASVASGKGRSVIATTFGGPNDPGTGSTGYRGDNLNGQSAFAELGYTGGDAATANRLGGLPYRTPLRISYGGKSVIARKLDIGAGAPGAALDLWYQTAHSLGFPEPGKGNVNVEGLSRGGRISWGGWHARGADFTAREPTLIGVGENGPERVTVTPKGKGGGRGVTIAGPLVGKIVVNPAYAGASGEAIVREIEAALARVAMELASGADDSGVTE